MFPIYLPRSLLLAQELISPRVRPGDTVADATAGNGHDTLFLASLAGRDGRVFSFDIQEFAATSTRERAARLPQVRVIHAGHEKAAEFIPPDQKLAAVMFNLGYLPGSDKAVVTQPETTLAALAFFLEQLLPGGIITLVCYTGHPGGAEESRAIGEWASGLDQEVFAAAEYRFVNQRNQPPSLLAVERKTPHAH